MKGQELIDWIIENNLKDATVKITALLQYDCDHDCPSTEDFDLQKTSKDMFTIYVGTNLQR